MKKKFDKTSLKEELESLMSTAKGDLNIIFDWYDNPDHNWQYGSQQKFLRWIFDELAKQGMNLSPHAIRKRYQRNQTLSPEQLVLRRNKRNNDTARENAKASEDFEKLFPSDYQESFRGLFGDDRVNEIYNRVQEEINLFCHLRECYILHRRDICARGIWVNYKMAKKILDVWDIGNKFELTTQDLLRVKKESGCFIVFADSQMKKTTKTLGEGYWHIEKKREEIIKSGVIEEQDQFYVFRKNYAFSSPSSAASVLLGINVNGQVIWRDCRGRTFREMHQKFDKIKRGPGRPKKFS